MSSDEYTKLADWLMQIEKRLEIVEGASRFPANSEQPLVGPPDKSEERPAALARPATISELRTLIKMRIAEWDVSGVKWEVRKTVIHELRSILKGLGKLDQGPVAQCPSEDESQTKGYANQFDNRI